MPEPILEKPVETAEEPAPAVDTFTLKQRFLLWLISSLAYYAIVLVGSTLRFEVSAEDEEGPLDRMWGDPPIIAPFWHRCIFAAAKFYRDRGVAVMTSQSFDGEYIARIITRLGFVPVRGSSSRGGARALIGMHDVIRQPGIAAFTIDGPRGPRYVAKFGPVALSKNTGAPIRCFYVGLSRAWELHTWDRLMIPKPWARAYVRFSAPIVVPAGADDAQMKEMYRQMQSALERVQAYAEEQARRG